MNAVAAAAPKQASPVTAQMQKVLDYILFDEVIYPLLQWTHRDEHWRMYCRRRNVQITLPNTDKVRRNVVYQTSDSCCISSRSNIAKLIDFES